MDYTTTLLDDSKVVIQIPDDSVANGFIKQEVSKNIISKETNRLNKGVIATNINVKVALALGWNWYICRPKEPLRFLSPPTIEEAEDRGYIIYNEEFVDSWHGYPDNEECPIATDLFRRLPKWDSDLTLAMKLVDVIRNEGCGVHIEIPAKGYCKVEICFSESTHPNFDGRPLYGWNNYESDYNLSKSICNAFLWYRNLIVKKDIKKTHTEVKNIVCKPCTHTSHCCIVFGCKYGYSDCPVWLGYKPQEYLTEDSEQYFKSVNDAIDSVSMEELLERRIEDEEFIERRGYDK